MGLSLNQLVPKTVKKEKVVDQADLLKDKLEKYDNIITDYFSWKTNIVKMATVLKDPDITDKQIAEICKESLDMSGKTESSLNSFLTALFNCDRLTQSQVDSVLEKFSSKWDLVGKWDWKYFTQYQIAIYKNYTPSLNLLVQFSGRGDWIRDSMHNFFPYIRKMGWNAKSSFDDVVNFYKNQVISCTSIKQLEVLYYEFPEAFQNFNESEKKTIFKNIINYTPPSNGRQRTEYSKFQCLELLFSPEEMDKFWTPSDISDYNSYIYTESTKERNQRQLSTNDFLWKLLTFEKKEKIVNEFINEPDPSKLLVLQPLIRWLSKIELEKNNNFRENIESLIEMWIAPIPDSTLPDLTKEKLDQLVISMYANKEYYNPNKMMQSLRLAKDTPVINDLKTKIIPNVAKLHNDLDNRPDLYLSSDVVKNDPKLVQFLLSRCKMDNWVNYSTLYDYYLNGMELSTIREVYASFTPPSETAEKTWNIDNYTMDVSSINFWKPEFDEQEFKALVNVKERDVLLSIFAEGSLNWKKSLGNITNYANFLLALRDNEQLKEILNGYKNPLIKSSLPNLKKQKDELITILNGEKFSNISNYNRLLYPIETLTIDINDKSSVINFLQVLSTSWENILKDKEYLKSVFDNVPLKEIVFYLGSWRWFKISNPLFSIFIDKFVSEFDTIPAISKKVALDKLIQRINDAGEIQVSFSKDTWDDFNWDSMIEFLKLLLKEKPKTSLKISLALKIAPDIVKNSRVKEYIDLFINNILQSNDFKPFYKKELTQWRRIKEYTDIISNISSNKLTDNETVKKLWSVVLDNIKNNDLSSIVSTISNNAQSTASKNLWWITVPRRSHIWDDTPICKERLKCIADIFKTLPIANAGFVLDAFMSSSSHFDSNATPAIKQRIKDYIVIWWGWIKLIINNEEMRGNYGKELAIKFEQWYQNKELDDLKRAFTDMDELETEVFVDFFKSFIYPILTKMTITSIQKAKYLWSILNKKQFKAIIDSVK